jgi:hypothetical protein
MNSITETNTVHFLNESDIALIDLTQPLQSPSCPLLIDLTLSPDGTTNDEFFMIETSAPSLPINSSDVDSEHVTENGTTGLNIDANSTGHVQSSSRSTMPLDTSVSRHEDLLVNTEIRLILNDMQATKDVLFNYVWEIMSLSEDYIATMNEKLSILRSKNRP